MNTKKMIALRVALVALLALQGLASARITGTAPTNPDAACWGPDGAEACVDASGNVVPTTDNDTTSGSSSLRWSNVHTYDLTVADDVTVSDDVSVTGDIFNVAGSTLTVTAAASISLAGQCGKLVRLQTDGADRTTNTTNTFTGGVEGCIYYLYHTGANGGGTITLDDNALFDVPGNVVLGTGDGAIVACVAGTVKFALLGTSDN